MRVHLRMRVFANRAGVHEDHVCAFTILSEPIARLLEQGTDQLGVILVHLTAEGLNVDLTHAGFTIQCGCPFSCECVPRPIGLMPL